MNFIILHTNVKIVSVTYLTTACEHSEEGERYV